MDGMNMKTGFRRVGPASCVVAVAMGIPERLRAQCFELLAVHVPEKHRNKGYATTLIHSVCRDADAANNHLILTVDPYLHPKRHEVDGMGKADLKSWYEVRFGFQQIQESPILMMRPPGATPRVGLKLIPQVAAIIEGMKHV